MENQYGANLIGKFNLQSFSHKQHRQYTQLDHRPVSRNQKLTEITFSYSFNLDVLITHIEISLNRIQHYEKLFEFYQLVNQMMSNRGQYATMMNFKIHPIQSKQQINKINVEGVGFTNCIKAKFILKTQAFQEYQQELELKKDRNKTIQQENIIKIIKATLNSIEIYGFLPNSNPGAVYLTRLLNISQTFKKLQRLDEAAQSDILVALSLINARRFIQGAQLLKKVSKYLVNKYTNSRSNTQFTKLDRTWFKQSQKFRDSFEDIQSAGRSYISGRAFQGSKYLLKAAKVQLLLAQTINHPTLLHQKLQAYIRANAFYLGNVNPPSIIPNTDYEDVLANIGPQIFPFLIKMLNDKSEPLKIASLKSIEFIFQTLGCTLANNIVQLLKCLIQSYPFPYSEQNQNMPSNQKLPSSRTKAITDSYHHLLQTLLSLLSQLSRKYLRAIFNEVILSNLSILGNVNSNNSFPIATNSNFGTQNLYFNQLKLYLLRFSQKILSICANDVEISVQFIVIILNLYQHKSLNSMKTQLNKHTVHNLSFFAQKILQVIKTKILIKYDPTKLVSICQWINDYLVELCQNDMAPLTVILNGFYFNQILDFIMIIYSKRVKCKLDYLIQSLIYFLNMTLSQDGLPFQKILLTLCVLINQANMCIPDCQIAHEIIQRIMKKSEVNNLTLKELKILIQLLNLVREIDQEWLELYLSCIPHSTFDETYTVFSLMIDKGIHKMSKKIMQKIVKTMLDQYTVKGKAHQQSKQHLIDILLLPQNCSHFLTMLNICLLENSAPELSNYYAKKKRINQHNFDSKLFKTDCELFQEKLGLAQSMLSKIQSIQHHYICSKLQNQEFIIIIHKALQKLITANNTKFKLKALNFVKHLINIFSSSKVMKPQISSISLFFSKAILSLLKQMMSNNRDYKLQYNIIHTLDYLFEKILVIEGIGKQQQESLDESKFNFMDGNLQQIKESENSFNIKETFYHTLRLREFMKLWQLLVNLSNSPWQSVKETIAIFISNFFIFDIGNYGISLQLKIAQMSKPLLKSLFSSSDSSEKLRGIKILACILGMARKFQNKNQVIPIIKANSKHFKDMFVSLYQMKQDSDQNISEIAAILCELCFSPQNLQLLKKKLMVEKKNHAIGMDNSFCTFNLGDEFLFEKKMQGSFQMNFTENSQTFFRENSHLEVQEDIFLKIQDKNQDQVQEISTQIWNKLQEFRLFVNKTNTFKPEQTERQSFAQAEQQFFQAGQDKAQSSQVDNKSEEENLQFEDLGIIELDDQEWGEEQNHMKITQKLPLKKIYKLSPSVGGTSKPQRIRSKRYHQPDLDYRENIIVDQVQGKIQSKPLSNKEIKSDQTQSNETKNRPRAQRNNFLQSVDQSRLKKIIQQQKQIFQQQFEKFDENQGDFVPLSKNQQKQQEIAEIQEEKQLIKPRQKGKNFLSRNNSNQKIKKKTITKEESIQTNNGGKKSKKSSRKRKNSIIK